MSVRTLVRTLAAPRTKRHRTAALRLLQLQLLALALLCAARCRALADVRLDQEQLHEYPDHRNATLALYREAPPEPLSTGSQMSLGLHPELLLLPSTTCSEKWSELFSLRDPLATGAVDPPADDTWHPPHLRDCARLAAQRAGQDERKEDASPPEWMEGGDKNLSMEEIMDGEVSPHTPWVSGADEDSLNLTRAAQAAIWIHQHPMNCSHPSVSFLLVDWWGLGGHGIGSQINGMTAALALALKLRRVLVISRSYHRARHDGCAGGRWGSFDCYFVPVTSRECQLAAAAEKQVPGGRTLYRGTHYTGAPLRALCPKALCSRVGGVAATAEEWGVLKGSAMGWWRAQATRYLLRWPSQYLCRLENAARHAAYGYGSASAALQAAHRQRHMAARGGRGTVAAGQLESDLWWGAEGELYAPRPIVSVHVRGGAKRREMSLWPLRAYMEQAERIRRHNPDTKSVWLATMFKSVVAETAQYPDWAFYYTRQARLAPAQEGAQIDDIRDPHPPPGATRYQQARTGVDASFVNLLLAAQCDYFVGTLGSNWDRLIDQLRQTGGGLRRGYIALNYGE